MISILTFNAAIQDVRILRQSMYRPLNAIDSRLAELINQLKLIDADIVCLQEIYHPDLQHKLYSAVQSIYPHAIGFAMNRFKLRLGSELLIFSKFHLHDEEFFRFKCATLEERCFTSKGFQKVTVNLPKVGKINLFNFHMSAGGYRSHPESRAMETIRFTQIQQLLNITLDKMPTLLVGDLNAGPEASNNNYRQVLNDGFKDSFKMADGNGLTWDPENPLVLSGSESYLPAQRIDHIFVNHAALSRLSPISGEVVLTEKSIHVDKNQSIPISDHYGVQVRFTIKESI